MRPSDGQAAMRAKSDTGLAECGFAAIRAERLCLSVDSTVFEAAPPQRGIASFKSVAHR